jgi:hypothetical protein
MIHDRLGIDFTPPSSNHFLLIMKIRIWKYSCVLLILTGCSLTRITSVKAPIHGKYSRVLLMADFDYLETLNDYESAFQDALLTKGISSVRGIDVFVPLRTYSDSEMTAGIAAQNIDAILFLVPAGVSTGSTTLYNSFSESFHTHKTTDAVYSEVWLKDAKTKQAVYRASISTALTEMSAYENDLFFAAKEMVRDLWQSDFLSPTVKPKHNSPNPNEN